LRGRESISKIVFGEEGGVRIGIGKERKGNERRMENTGIAVAV
jgi:hypothetical protein